MTTVPWRSKTSAAGLFSTLRSDEHSPMSAMIEIADRCNEVCVHCYQVQGQKGEMTTEQVFQVIDELAEMGILFLTISGGEPTLRHDFLDIVAHARKRKFAVKIYTNGLSMTRELAGRLAELAVQEVQISLYSHRAEVHDWVTRVPGSFHKTVNAAKYLLEARVAVLLKSPLMSFNVGDYRAFIAFVSGLGADYAVDPHLDPREDGDRTPELLRITDEQYLEVIGDPLVVGERGQGPVKDKLDRGVCGACSGNVHIEANGEMRPCTQMTLPVGNALDGVQEAWRQNEDAQFLRTLTWADMHGCRDCDLRPYCGRCFANAHTEGGDALGPYRTACHKARLGYRVRHGVSPDIAPTADTERDPKLGPYREIAPGRFLPIDDVVTPEDKLRAAKHGWVRRTGGGAASVGEQASAQPGKLVQIRRPGKRTARPEHIPGQAGAE